MVYAGFPPLSLSLSFFSVVVGRPPLVGEKVLVKAVQDPSQSVKWTAQRVQVLNGQVI